MTTSLLLMAPVLAPGLGAAGYALLGWRAGTRWLGTACAASMLAAAIGLAVTVTSAGTQLAVGGLLRVDALSAYLLIVIGAVAMLATGASPAYLDGEIRAGHASARTAYRHSLLVQLFLAAMATAVLAANLGTLWVAIEATTIATAFLVGQRRTRTSVEAAWKYVLICSVGIALALLGAILLNYASAHTPAAAGLDLAGLAASAESLDPSVTRIAVALLVIGFGTKVGLVPLHAWLPDAHSQAPAPVSALMSGVLLAVAFYAVLRVKVIADAALGEAFVRSLLVVMALATLAVAATLLLAQRDYKRMLAYSSMEHMGLLALGAAAGSRLAMAGVLLHILGHGLIKAVLFLSTGRILQQTGSRLVTGVRGLAGREPVLAGLVGVGMLALVAFPPFSLFASELGIFRAGFDTGLGWATGAALLLVLVITAALLGHTGTMLLGDPASATHAGATPADATHADATHAGATHAGATHPGAAGAFVAPVRTPVGTAVPLGAGLAACALLGLSVGPLQPLLDLAADILQGTP